MKPKSLFNSARKIKNISDYSTPIRKAKTALDKSQNGRESVEIYSTAYVEQMVFLKGAYDRCFESSIQFQERPQMLQFFSSNFLGIISSITIPHKLRKSDFSQRKFTSTLDAYIGKVTAGYTEHAIQIGKTYVTERERTFSRRDGIFSAFSDLRVPRYYFVFLVSQRLFELGKMQITKDIIHEYKCLLKFVEQVDLEKKDYFYNASAENGFFEYLDALLFSLNQITKIAITYNKRKPISETLKILSGQTNAYKRNLSLYLIKCLSSEKIMTHTSFMHLCGVQGMIDKELGENKRYNAIKIALTSSSKSLREYLSKNTISLPREIEQSIQNTSEKLKVKRSYEALIFLLQRFTEREEMFDKVSDFSVKFGEIQFITNKVFNDVVSFNLLSIKNILSECEKHINLIEKANKTVTKNITRYKKGYLTNADDAKSSAYFLSSIKSGKINPNLKAVETHLNELMEEETPDIQSYNTELLCDVRSIIEKDKAVGLIYDDETTRHFSLINKNNLDTLSQKSKDFLDEFPQVISLTKNTPQDIEAICTQVSKAQEHYHQAIDFLSKIEKIIHAANKINKLICSPLVDNNKNLFLYKELKKLVNNCRYKGHFFSQLDVLGVIFELVSTDISPHMLNLNEIAFKHCRGEEERKKTIKCLIKLKSECFSNLAMKIKLQKESLEDILPIEKNKNLIEHYAQLILKIKPTPEEPKKIPLLENASLREILTHARQSNDKETLHHALSLLYSKLTKRNYVIHWGGGDTFTDNQNNRLTLPHHVATMLTLYRSDFFSQAAPTLTRLREIRAGVFQAAETALRAGTTCCFGLFRKRDPSTQALYQAFQEKEENHSLSLEGKKNTQAAFNAQN